VSGDAAVALADCEAIIEDAAELQWRQVHPNFVDEGVVSREAFRGTSDAPEEVSTIRESVATAEAAHHHYIGAQRRTSAGTWAVTIAEVETAGCRTVDDSACDLVDTPGHSYIDLRGRSRADKKVARASLATAATIRGRQFPPSPYP